MSLIDRLLLRGSQVDGDSSVGMVRIAGRTWSARWSFTRTLDSVYANPTAKRCVERAANDFQRPDWQLRERGKNKDVVDAGTNEQAYDVLTKPRRGVMSGTTAQYWISRDLDLSGGTFWLKLRGGEDGFGDGGPVGGLRRMPTQRMTVIADDDDDIIGFAYQDRKGRVALIHPDDIVYVRYPHPDRSADRLAPALVAGLSAETDTAAMRFNYELLSNDSALPGYLVVEGLDKTQFKEWAAQWDAGESPGKTRFLRGNNAKYIKVGQTNQELTYNELRNASREDICRAFGIPKVIIDPTDATFSNMGVATASYMKSLILPRWTMVADEFTMQLGDELGFDIGFNLDEIEELQEGLKDYVDRTVPLVDRGVLTINDVRKDLKLDLVAWGYVPAPKLGIIEAATTDAPTEPVAPTPEPESDAGDPEKSISTREMRALPSGLTTKDGTAIDGFDSRVDRHEKSTKRAMERFFERQGNAIEKRIRGKKGRTKAVDDWWDGERWNEELASTTLPLLGDTVDSVGTLSLNTFDPGADFDADTDRIKTYLDGRSAEIATLVNGTTEADVRAIIADVSADGGSVSDMADAIKDYFKGDDATAVMRAERVARTEIIGAANFAAIEGARQSGIVDGKTWLAASDAEADCASISGETVALDDDFEGGVGQPPLHPNCRCTLTFQIKSED